MSLLGVIAGYTTGTYTRRRYTAPTITVGRAVTATPVDSLFDASIQPMTGEDLEAISEAERGLETRQLWTATELRTTGAAGAADTITIDSETWKVIRVFKFGVLEIFYRAVIARQAIP